MRSKESIQEAMQLRERIKATERRIVWQAQMYVENMHKENVKYYHRSLTEQVHHLNQLEKEYKELTANRRKCECCGGIK